MRLLVAGMLVLLASTVWSDDELPEKEQQRVVATGKGFTVTNGPEGRRVFITDDYADLGKRMHMENFINLGPDLPPDGKRRVVRLRQRSKPTGSMNYRRPAQGQRWHYQRGSYLYPPYNGPLGPSPAPPETERVAPEDGIKTWGEFLKKNPNHKEAKRVR